MDFPSFAAHSNRRRGLWQFSQGLLAVSVCFLSTGLVVLSLAVNSSIAPASPFTMQKWFEKAVARVEAAFTPAQARPGQTVTWTFTLHLHEGYHTYPTRQTDPQAAAFVNEFRFPEPSEVIFVGAVQDPKNVQTRAEPELGILSLRYCSGVVVYSRPAVVHPQARPGPVTIKGPKVRLNICDKNNCFPTKEIDTTATLTILEGPAVPIEATYADEVRRIIDKSHPKK